MLTIDWLTGRSGALWLLAFRIVQGIGGAFLVGNSGAILTDAFPPQQRGLALGINNIAGISGSFIGLVLGGLLAPINWRLVFLISVPCGIFGTIWAYLRLRDLSERSGEPVDWLGNVTFAAGLILVMTGITQGVQPYDGHAMGWSSPMVIGFLAGGAAILALFGFVETRVAYPMFRLSLFKIKAYTFGTLSTFLSALGRGGLMFMLIIWLQGIWLPRHGYSFAQTPLWAGIYMLPTSIGMLIAGPISGYLSDRFGARPFATGGMLAAACTFVGLELLPIDFPYPVFAVILLLNGLSMGCFASPNRAAVMNSLPARHRGAGGGMNSTFMNSAQVFSLGIFFSLMIAGLAASLPATLSAGLIAQGVPPAAAHTVSQQPPVAILFASFLGYNPISHLLGPQVVAHLSGASLAQLTGRAYFPTLISGPFQSGLHVAFAFSIVACLIAAAASWSRGARYVAAEHEAAEPGQAGEPGPAARPAATGPADDPRRTAAADG
jgi:MFS family permease